MKAKKPETKAQRDKRQLAALTRRITDIYSGAGEGMWLEGERWPTPTELSRIVPAVRETFGDDTPEFLWSQHNLNHWEAPSELANFLYRYGVRP